MDENRKRKYDTMDLAAELSGISALCFILSSPFGENDNRMSDHILGDALHGIACYIDRISNDVGDLEIETER